MPELETPKPMCRIVTQEFVMLRGHKSMGLWLTFRPEKANIHSSSTILQLHLGCIVIDVVRIRSSETSAFTELLNSFSLTDILGGKETRCPTQFSDIEFTSNLRQPQLSSLARCKISMVIHFEVGCHAFFPHRIFVNIFCFVFNAKNGPNNAELSELLTPADVVQFFKPTLILQAYMKVTGRPTGH